MTAEDHDHHDIEALELALGDAVSVAMASGRWEDKVVGQKLLVKLQDTVRAHLRKQHGGLEVPDSRKPETFHSDLHPDPE